MTDRESPPPKPAPPKRGDARAERERRLAEALRANLKRRKEQSRGRAEDAEPKESEQEPGRRGEESS
jgi:hypothetical protein